MAHRLLEIWERNFNCKEYWRTQEGQKVFDSFVEFLESEGHKFIDNGKCADVYQILNESFVIKVLRPDGEQILFTDPNDHIPKELILPIIVSKDGYCCIQELVDCSDHQLAWELAGKPNAPKRNFGLKDGNPVIIDQW